MFRALSSIFLLSVDATQCQITDVDDEMTPEYELDFKSESDAALHGHVRDLVMLHPRTTRRRLLSGQQQMTLLFVRAASADQVIPVEVPCDGTVADILQALPAEFRHCEVMFQGESMPRDESLADLGMCMQSEVQLTAPPTDCMRLTLALDNTDVFAKLGWPRITVHSDEQNCCAFDGVECEKDEHGRDVDKITKIVISFKNFEERMKGRIEWSLLPRSLKWLDLYGNVFEGVVAWKELPRSLKVLHLGYNYFRGEVEWHKLPPSLRVLHLESNRFHGEVAWQALPRSLRVLCLDGPGNEFHGKVAWQALPPKLKVLRLNYNRFEGQVAWNELSRYSSLTELNLAGRDDLYNRFEGDVTWKELPRSLKQLNLNGNRFEGEVAWKDLPRSLKSLSLGGNRFHGEVAWQDLPPSLEELFIAHSLFNGTVAWQAFPQTLRSLFLRDTRLNGTDAAKEEICRELRQRGHRVEIYW